MKHKKYFITIFFGLIFSLVFHTNSNAQNVYDGDLTLSSQEEINSFNYTAVTGNLYIDESQFGNIVNLDPLNTLTSVGGSLLISNNAALTNIDSLHNLTSVGGSLYIANNTGLVRYCGLCSIVSSGTYTDIVVLDNGENPTIPDIIAGGPCITNQPPDCSGAVIADQSVDVNCQATISGADVTGVTDPDSDPLTLTVSPTLLVLGSNTVLVTADDGNGGTCSTEITVNVIENTDPVITVISNPIELWPPNHQYVTIDVSECVVSVSDNCSSLSASDVYIVSVSSDEEEDAEGEEDGNTLNDIVIAQDCKSVQLRRERQEDGNGRVYTIQLSVNDGNGNTGSVPFQVTVSFDKSGDPAVNDGPAYTVTSSCGTNNFAKGNNPEIAGENPARLTPDNFILEQNHPNPYNPTTTINYQIPNAGFVTLKVYDVLGNEVSTLVTENKESGRYQITFDDSALSSGVYIYQLRVNEFLDTKKMVLMK